MKEHKTPPKDAQVPPIERPLKRLVRLPKNGKIAGVCAGLADYLDVDVSLMRIIFVILTLASGGFGILLYFVLAIIMPVGNLEDGTHLDVGSIGQNVNRLADEVRSNGSVDRMRNYLGMLLILLGAWLLSVRFFPDWITLDWNIVWPVGLVLIGIILIVRSRR